MATRAPGQVAKALLALTQTILDEDWTDARAQMNQLDWIFSNWNNCGATLAPRPGVLSCGGCDIELNRV